MKLPKTINCMPRSRFPEFHAAMEKDEWEYCEAQERRFLDKPPPPDNFPLWCYAIIVLCAASLCGLVFWLLSGGVM